MLNSQSDPALLKYPIQPLQGLYHDSGDQQPQASSFAVCDEVMLGISHGDNCPPDVSQVGTVGEKNNFKDIIRPCSTGGGGEWARLSLFGKYLV